MNGFIGKIFSYDRSPENMKSEVLLHRPTNSALSAFKVGQLSTDTILRGSTVSTLAVEVG